jgi:hypothetical protein
MRIYTPPNYVGDENEGLIFLAGPIQGAPRWQDRAVEIFEESRSGRPIASPRIIRSQDDWCPGITAEEQIRWERTHLEISGNRGTILVYIPVQVNFNITSYSKTTRQELGEQLVRHKYESTRIVIGVEDNAPGRDYIKICLEMDYPDIRMYRSLEETCLAALDLASK